MNVYRITYELRYPDADNDIRDAYVLAESFIKAQTKLERTVKGEYESAKIITMQLLSEAIILV